MHLKKTFKLSYMSCLRSNILYIAMNRFRINLGKGAHFEEIWRKRDTHLKDVPGFLSFNLIKGKAT